MNRNIPVSHPRLNPPDITQGDTPKETPQRVTQEYHRLSLAAYRSLEQSLDAPYVRPTTTETQTAFMLGQQHVLKLLRDGFVVGA